MCDQGLFNGYLQLHIVQSKHSCSGDAPGYWTIPEVTQQPNIRPQAELRMHIGVLIQMDYIHMSTVLVARTEQWGGCRHYLQHRRPKYLQFSTPAVDEAPIL